MALWIKHSVWGENDDAAVWAEITAVLINHLNEGKDLIIDAETRFGSHAFDTHFAHVSSHDLLEFLQEWANDNEPGWRGVKDFLGCVREYMGMPTDSLQRRMRDAARRMI